MKIHSATQMEITINSKWTKHSLMKRLLNHRYKLVLLPLLGLPVPVNKNEAEEKVNPASVVNKVEEQTTQRYGFENDFANYRFLPCTFGSLILFTILSGSDLFLLSNDKRKAVHEIGHLIALKAVQHPTTIDWVAIESSHIRRNRVKHTFPDNYDLGTDDQGKPSLRRFVQLPIVSRAGEAMERLVYGDSDVLGAYTDRLVNLVLRTVGFIYCLKLKPRQIFNYGKFLAQLEKRTQNILKQVNPETINELAIKLSEKRYWDSDEVENIVKEFGFDKLPAFEETVKEARKILE